MEFIDTASGPPASATRFKRLGAVLLSWVGSGLLATAHAQDGAPARGLTYGASLDAMLTASVEDRAAERSSDWVTELRPSVFLSSRSGRLVGTMSYAMSLTYRQNDTEGQNIHNQLAASFTGELIERAAYVDVTANVGQQSASAYGQQSAPGSTRDNTNRVEVGTLNVSPYLRGVAGSAVNYELRLTASGTNGRRSIAADSATYGSNLSLSSAIAGSLLGWGLTASHVKQDYRAGQETVSDRYSLSLSYLPDADVTLDARAGQESNDVASIVKTTYSNWGAGLTWRPSPRTRAQVQFDQRYFGKSHQVLLDHRMASLTLQFTSSREASNGIEAGAGSQPITLYQALDRLLTAQYPDPAERDVQIRLLLGNSDPNQLVGGGAINSGVTISQRNQLAMAYGFTRMSASVQAYTTSTESANPTAAAPAVRQWGYVGSLSYRLTPTASIGMTGSRLLTKGTDSIPGTELKSASLTWTDQLARRTTASLSLRYSVFNSQVSGYREAAITANLGQRF